MLVLRRRIEESISLEFNGAIVWVKVTGIEGGIVQLGIVTQPQEVVVLREELHKQAVKSA